MCRISRLKSSMIFSILYLRPSHRALEITVQKHPSIGLWQCHYLLRLDGHLWNHKRVYRVYTGLQLNIRRRSKKYTAVSSLSRGQYCCDRGKKGSLVNHLILHHGVSHRQACKMVALTICVSMNFDFSYLPFRIKNPLTSKWPIFREAKN
jgi:hypothetical protein